MNRILSIIILFVVFAVARVSAQAPALQKTQMAVYFDTRVYTLTQRAQKKLDSLVTSIKSQTFAELYIQLYGHCDSIGDNGYNDILSTQRAEAVKSYLTSKGIADSSITVVKGLGKHQPLNNNTSETERSFNRRVEIVVEDKMAGKKIIKETPAITSAPPLRDSAKSDLFDVAQVKVDDIIQLPDINFYPDRHVLLRSSIKTLHKLLSVMQANPSLRIEIRGHVCCLGEYVGDAFDEDSNSSDLSLQRARVVYSYLVESGIAKDRMTYVGLGGRFPLVEEFTDYDKAKNRRVEIKILSK